MAVPARPWFLTVQLYRDLEIGLVDGGQNLAVTSVLPVAQAARPETVFETAGAQVVQLNDTSAATLPVFDGDVTDTTWIAENAAAPSFSALEVKQVTSTPKCCSSRIAHSRRLAALSTDKAAFEQSLLTEMRRAIKVEIERKYFSGSGSSDWQIVVRTRSIIVIWCVISLLLPVPKVLLPPPLPPPPPLQPRVASGPLSG